MRPLTIISGACVAFCLFLAGATADDAKKEKPPAPQVRKIYDVSDLALNSAIDASTTAVVPPTDLSTGKDPRSGARGGGGGGGGGLFGNGGGLGNAPKTTTLAERTEAIGKLIQETIEPSTWGSAEGEGWIRSLGPRLIVQNTDAAHAQIAEFLADLRKNQNRSIQISATWVALSDNELRSVTVPSTTPAKGSALSRVNLSAIDQIKGAVLHRTEISTLTGIAVNVTAGRARTVLSSLDAVVGSGAAALQPNIDLLLSGTALQLTSVLSPDGASVRIDLRAVESSWEPADGPPIKIPGPIAATQPTVPSLSSPAPASTPPAEIERLNLPMHYITTSVRIPTQQATLIGGFATSAKDSDARHWYLILEASANLGDKEN
jgi:hypothetical protein